MVKTSEYTIYAGSENSYYGHIDCTPSIDYLVIHNNMGEHVGFSLGAAKGLVDALNELIIEQIPKEAQNE